MFFARNVFLYVLGRKTFRDDLDNISKIHENHLGVYEDFWRKMYEKS